MKIAYITPENPEVRPLLWSGTALATLNCMRSHGHAVDIKVLPSTFVSRITIALKFRYHNRRATHYLSELDTICRSSWRGALERDFKRERYDAVFAWLPWLTNIAETDRPKFFWYDTTFIQTQPLYYEKIARESLENGLKLDRAACNGAAAAVYSTEWSRQSAISDYGADPAKVHVVPFGANLKDTPSREEVMNAISKRMDRNDGVLKLLFVGLNWERKGGDTAVAVARELNRMGSKTKLTVIGAVPELNDQDREFVEVVGRLDKDKPADLARFRQYYLDSDFFIMTSHADSSPIVYCEAMAHGCPSLATITGGVTTIVRDGITGYAFPWTDDVNSVIAKRVIEVYSDRAGYRRLCESSHELSQTVFNWKAAGDHFNRIMEQAC